MKNIYFINLIFLIIFVSCENQAFNNENLDNEPATRSSIDPETFAMYNTLFSNITTRSLGYGNGVGIEYMKGEIGTFSEGVEYDFILYSELKGAINSVVWAIGGDLIYNDKNKPSIWGVNKKEVRFTIRFRSSNTKIMLALEREAWANQSGMARLIFDGVRYNGERLYPPLQGDFDLNVDAHYRDRDPDSGSSEYHWKCNNCGFLNGAYNTTCVSCGD